METGEEHGLGIAGLADHDVSILGIIGAADEKPGTQRKTGTEFRIVQDQTEGKLGAFIGESDRCGLVLPGKRCGRLHGDVTVIHAGKRNGGNVLHLILTGHRNGGIGRERTDRIMDRDRFDRSRHEFAQNAADAFFPNRAVDIIGFSVEPEQHGAVCHADLLGELRGVSVMIHSLADGFQNIRIQLHFIVLPNLIIPFIFDLYT